MTSASDRLISSLVKNLEPVRPLPRLRLAFSIILAVWATLLGVVLWVQETEVGVRSLFSSRLYFGCFAGLAIASIGATGSALAAGIPGRERVETGGMLLALVGLLAAALACLVGMNDLTVMAHAGPPGVDGMCFRKGALFSLLPAGVILSFLVRGWSAHPFRAAMIALLASGALGALIVQTSCGYIDARHLLISHFSVPIVFAALGVYPLFVILRHLRR